MRPILYNWATPQSLAGSRFLALSYMMIVIEHLLMCVRPVPHHRDIASSSCLGNSKQVLYNWVILTSLTGGCYTKALLQSHVPSLFPADYRQASYYWAKPLATPWIISDRGSTLQPFLGKSSTTELVLIPLPTSYVETEPYQVGHAGREFTLPPLAEITTLSHALHFITKHQKPQKNKNAAKRRKQFMLRKINCGFIFFVSFLSISPDHLHFLPHRESNITSLRSN